MPSITPKARRAPLTFNAWLRYDIVRRRLAAMPQPETILELGLGLGAVGSRLARLGRYTGVEPDPVSREVAISRLPAAASVIADLSELDPSAQFDLVCAFEVLEHIEDDRGALAAWVERIRPGGRLLLSVPAFARQYDVMDERAGHFRRYEPEALGELAARVGLTEIEADSYGFPLGYALDHVRKLITNRQPTEGSFEDRTAGSGRLLQPPEWAGPITQGLTLPFRVAQRPFRRTRKGTGLVLSARRPRAEPVVR
jgi:SAM-dependent methyltransferase